MRDHLEFHQSSFFLAPSTSPRIHTNCRLKIETEKIYPKKKLRAQTTAKVSLYVAKNGKSKLLSFYAEDYRLTTDVYNCICMYISCGDCIEMDRNYMRRVNVTGRGYIRSPVATNFTLGYEKGIIIIIINGGRENGGYGGWNSR